MASQRFSDDGGDVLAFAEQPDDIEVVVTLEVEPEQWEARHPPISESGNAN